MRPPWNAAETGAVDWYHPAGSGHKPRVCFRILSDGLALWVRYTVEDRWVRCVHRSFQAPVFEDSCCEIFLQPAESMGYFNIETNTLGTMMVSYITDPKRTCKGFKGQIQLGPEANREIERCPSIAIGSDGVIDPEISSPVTWELGLRIPFSLLGTYMGTTILPGNGAVWRGNVFKCSENSSHPHWGAWSSIGDRLDFHQPDRFGELVFV